MIKNNVVAVAALAVALGSSACGKADGNPAAENGGPVTASESKGWSVVKDGKVVEWIDSKPGPLISRAAPPPPGTPATTSRFMSATSKDIMSEGALQKLRAQAAGFEDYVNLLRKNGYEVRPATDED